MQRLVPPFLAWPLLLACATATSGPPVSDGAPPPAPPPRGPSPSPRGPGSAQLEKAKKLARANDVDGAIAATRAAIAEGGGLETAHLLLASLCGIKQDNACVAQALEGGLAELPQSTELLHARGMYFLESGEVPPAIADLERAQELTTGKDPDIAADLAYAYVFVGRIDEAELLAAAARRAAPRSFAAAYAHGEALIRKDRAKDALEAYQAALAIEPGNALAKRRVALALSKQGEDAKALAIYVELIKSGEDQDPGLHAASAGALIKLGRADEAVKAMRAAVQLAPKERKYLELLLRAEEAAGDKKGAKSTKAKLDSLGGAPR